MITTGTLNANLIYSAGYQVKSTVMVKGTIANGATIPMKQVTGTAEQKLSDEEYQKYVDYWAG